MMSDSDLVKIYQAGDHELTLSHLKNQCKLKISVKRLTFQNLTFPQNNVFTYDGKAHTVELDGDIPASAVITYTGGNSFVNAGEYDVIAVVSCEGYVTAKYSTTVKIERAKFDMSGVKFASKEVVYDGNAHAVAISGKLPEGVSMPVYTINEKVASSATDVGEYLVKATFSNNNPNYEPIPQMEATIKITPAEYTIKGVDLVFRNESGEILGDATKTYDGKIVSFDLNDINKISKKVSVAFSVFDEEGNVISISNKTTNIKNSGIYTVKAEFTLADGKNYKPIEPIVRTFEITKADYELNNITLTSNSVVHDEKEHSLKIDGSLPIDVTVSYEYYLNGVLVVDENNMPLQAVSAVGRYTVKAIFTHADENYKPIASISAILQITENTDINEDLGDDLGGEPDDVI